MKLDGVAEQVDLRMCIKDDILGPKYFQGDNQLCLLVQNPFVICI